MAFNDRIVNTLQKFISEIKDENLRIKVFDLINRDFDLNNINSLISDLEKSNLEPRIISKIKESLFDELSHQKNYNHFVFLEKGSTYAEDLYTVNFDYTKPEDENIHFFQDQNFIDAYQDIWFRKAISKLEQGKKYDALGSFSVSKKVSPFINTHPGLDVIMDEIFNENEKLYETNPELSFISDFKDKKFHQTISSLEKTESNLKKELILMVNNKDLIKVQADPIVRNRVVSIEDDNGIVKRFGEKEGLNIRLILKNDDSDKVSSYNIGAFKSLISKPKYVSFIEMGDLIDEKFYSKLRKDKRTNKNVYLGKFGVVNSRGNSVEDINARWANYLINSNDKNISKIIEKHNYLFSANHIISHEVLEDILRKDLFLFDPRLNEHSFEHELIKRISKEYGPNKISYIDEEVVRKVNEFSSNTKNGKKNIVFVTSTLENTHGVPVVMNNIASNLPKDKYNVFYLVNDFDSHKVKLYDSSKNSFIEASDRKELLEIIETHNPQFLDDIDIIHSHTWHIYDDFKHFHTNGSDEMKLKDFLGKFKNSKFVFTDHSNPTEDEANINEDFQMNYSSLSDSEKESFIETNRIKKIDDDWKERWTLTSLKGRKEMSELADHLINVSDIQYKEGRNLLPPCNIKNRTTVYNGIDLLKFSNDDTINEKKDLLKNRFNISDDENVILYAGRFTEKKGFYDLAKSLKELRKKGVNYKVLLAGSLPKSEVRSKFEELVGSKDDSIIYTGRIKGRKDLAALYRLADVTVQPTHGECFNQVIGESLSQGTPVITSNVSGPKEVYVEKGWAHGVKKQDTTELANKLYDVLENKDKEKLKVKENILPEMKEKISLENMVKMHDEIYSKLSEKKKDYKLAA